MVVYWYKVMGMSITKIAKMFRVNKRLIQFILFPERQKKNLELRADRGGSTIYYDREYHNQAANEHRAYKYKTLKEIEKMKCKFVNIPKDERTEIYKRARERMLHWQANYAYAQSNYEQTKHGHFHKYNFDEKCMLIYWTEDKTIDFVYTDDLKIVIFKIARQSWARDLMNRAIRASKVTAN
jgi:transposase